MLSHRLGLYRNAYDNKLEEGQDTKLLRQTLGQLNLICPPGTCWSYQNVAYDGASELVENITHQPYERAVKQMLFNPIGMTQATISMQGLTGSKELGASAQCRTAPAGAQRQLLSRAGGRRHRQQHQGDVAVDDRADGRDARRAVAAGPQHHPCATGKDPGERGRLRKFLERLGEADYGYAVGAAMTTPAIASWSSPAALPAIAR